MGSAICGGIIAESYFKKQLAKKDGIYGMMMAWVMPDDKYKKNKAADKIGDHKKEKKLCDRKKHKQIT